MGKEYIDRYQPGMKFVEGSLEEQKKKRLAIVTEGAIVLALDESDSMWARYHILGLSPW